MRADVLDIVGKGAVGAVDLLGPADADALRAIGIDVDSIRERIEESFGPGRSSWPADRRRRRPAAAAAPAPLYSRDCPQPRASIGGHIPFTPRSKKVLELSLREAIHLRHNYIGTEHILLGLLREGEGLAAMVLVRRGLSIEELRQRVLIAIGKVA